MKIDRIIIVVLFRSIEYQKSICKYGKYYFYTTGEIKQFIGTDKNRSNFYGVRCSHVGSSINSNYNREFHSNICSNGWFTPFTFWFSNNIK
jgi:hypothetical protein